MAPKTKPAVFFSAVTLGSNKSGISHNTSILQHIAFEFQEEVYQAYSKLRVPGVKNSTAVLALIRLDICLSSIHIIITWVRKYRF